METTTSDAQATDQTDDRTADIADAESLIEEVSIDGMCGVY
jgi:mycofactocin precursor